MDDSSHGQLWNSKAPHLVEDQHEGCFIATKVQLTVLSQLNSQLSHGFRSGPSEAGIMEIGRHMLDIRCCAVSTFTLEAYPPLELL